MTGSTLIGGVGPAEAQKKKKNQVAYWLTVVHHNDGESQLIDAGSGREEFGGMHHFGRVVRKLRNEGNKIGGKKPSGVVTISAGDNFLAGPEWNVSLEKGPPYYDAMGMDLIGYDAITIGNHDFDFGPDVFENFVESFASDTPFLSANLDFGEEPGLKALEDEGRIAKSFAVRKKKKRIGIVGATTPMLPFITSPRKVKVDPDVAAAVQAEVNTLTNRGIKMIVLSSHLQSVEEDLALAGELRNVDVMIAGGGDELLANAKDALIPGDEEEVFGPYPLTAKDKQGRDVPVVTAPGDYKYVGRLTVGFNNNGRIVRIKRAKSGPVRVASPALPDGVQPLRTVLKWVVEPVQRAVEAMSQKVVANTQVALDGRRSQVRTAETNEGNLIADALLWQAQDLAPSFGVPEPVIGLHNGGGIRNDSIIGPGPVTEKDTFDMVPFGNFVAVVEDVTHQRLKEVLENAVSRVANVDGRFAQIAGFKFTYDHNGTAQIIDAEGNITTAGTRVRHVELDDGTVIVENGVVLTPAATMAIATVDFSARGGDQWPLGDLPSTSLGVTNWKGLLEYLDDVLNGVITSADYPEAGEGRITRLN